MKIRRYFAVTLRCRSRTTAIIAAYVEETVGDNELNMKQFIRRSLASGYVIVKCQSSYFPALIPTIIQLLFFYLILVITVFGSEKKRSHHL